MTDEHAAPPPPGTPGQRALGAMESAVRRAREAAGAAPLPPPGPTPSRRTPDWALGAAPPPQPDRRPDRPDRWLVTSVAAVAALVVIAAVALVVSLSAGTTSPPPPSTQAGSAHQAAPAPPSTGGAETKGGTTGGSTPASTTTSSTVLVAPAGPPVISSLTPSSGAAGQGIEVAGANFLSASGQIVATFNGQVAPTSCPAQNTCSVTVPPSTSASAEVVITTASGTSNAVTFTYGS